MLPAEIKVGHVFRYSYLWHWQHREGPHWRDTPGRNAHACRPAGNSRYSATFGEIADECIQIRSYRLAGSRLLSANDRGGAGVVALVGL
ncbi:MAG: hypothetical protein EOS14_04175 [Mesorhizobium sp.]|nr:MAG: hypothetical protein EOS14_04175 [Mesorhizobium sp.]